MEKTVPFNCLHCSQEVAAHRVVRRFLVYLAVKAPILHTFQAEDPVHISPEAFGTIPGTAPGVPAQLTQGNLPTLLSAYPRPVGQPPAEMLFLYNLIKSSPGLLPLFLQQQPQSLTQAVQFAQTGTAAPRDNEERALPYFCYNRWSLVFTYNDVYLMWPAINLFGFVVGYFYPFLTPGILSNTQILFALC